MAIMADETDFRSAQQVHAALVTAGQTVGLATVYRNLQILTEAGELDSLRSEEGETLYRRCAARRHHHHLVCTKCGRSEEVEGGPVERWAEAVASRYGYELVAHDAEVYGICRACQAARAEQEAQADTAER